MLFRLKKYILVVFLFPLMLMSCHPHDEFTGDPYGTYDALWSVIDSRYCFFPENGLDWDAAGKKYRERIYPGMGSRELFDVCSGLLSELKDGHVNLSSPFDIFYYREWWTLYPQNFSLRVLQQYYLEFDWMTTSGMMYKVLPGNIGYLRYPSFVNKIGEGNLDYVLAYFRDCKGLIIDIRDNGGGDMSNIDTFVSRFIPEKGIYGYISHKTGKGHYDFSIPYPIKYSPAGKGHLVWNKPVAVLINRSCYSAANMFAAVMRTLPDVRLIGSTTGGGGGLPFTADLPNGWKVRFSACPVTDKNGGNIESGVDPSPGCEVVSSDEDLVSGRDAVLDFAIRLLLNNE